ncbi:HPr family phosphocarrier protein [Amycolatopsis sp. EV170708-02-1]|uniref:HPr family phosphocarrier protein n=1 Tax=Amycolatopsis sp. EV170708-02-1 TaxID=2919322 RepID=UPI001F0B9A26|nr:HPr family phosphocarrier protein [Amycolatopsis sp. EV170708-02-1]UMP07022.1 HPr family phosphocarrier protein [Amycolatopsis sp. EV170708-02-1]
MSSRNVVIGSSVGLHARPARLLVDAVAKQSVRVRIGRSEDHLVDASSILAVMSLGVRGGEEIVLTAEGEGAEEAVSELAALLARDLDSGE